MQGQTRPRAQTRPNLNSRTITSQLNGQRQPQAVRSFNNAYIKTRAYEPVLPVATPQAPPQALVVEGQEDLTSTMLAAAPAQEQKQMLGERLFPLIASMHTDLAGKITGMLLEIDNSELLHMLESRESLQAKVCITYTIIKTSSNNKFMI